MNSNSTQSYRPLTLAEEVVNSITHGIGTFLSIVALVVLLVVAKKHEDFWHLTSFSIYGSTLIFLYLSSTLYHSVLSERTKKLFSRLDHASSLLLIAGTYTPILLTTFRDSIGWTLFGTIWGMAILGLAVRSHQLPRYLKILVGIYLISGLMFIMAGREIYQNLPTTSILFLITGGFSYALGVIFYVKNNRIYHRNIWHLFVLTGSILQFLAVYASMP